jgi:hypothetical protein
MNKKLTAIAFALALATSSAHAANDVAGLGADMTGADINAGAVLSTWNPSGPAVGYGFAALVDRYTDSGAQPWTAYTVGAEIVASNHSGVNQVAFGIATEAWADFGSYSMLTGLEATAINREPNNPWRKVSLWATFKNRPDTEYNSPPVDSANMNSQALRIESQPGTGFERGVVYAQASLHGSRNVARPVAIDFSEMDEAAVEGVDLIRFPDGCSLIYLGHGQLGTRCDK